MSHQRLGQARRHPGRTGRSLSPPSSSAVIVIGAVLAVLAMLTVITIGRQHSRPAAGGPAVPWLEPVPALASQAPIPLLSDPPTPYPSRSLSLTAAAAGYPRPAARPPSPGPAPSRTAERMLPAPGSRLSLVATGTTDLRLRHQDFRMRLATVGPRSPTFARADATFILRRGLADADCVSLESVNFPGRFMRHQNFALLLHQRERSRLFASDATFCPQAIGRETHFVLRSVNYPDRYLTVAGDRVLLSAVPAGSARSFRAAAAL